MRAYLWTMVIFGVIGVWGVLHDLHFQMPSKPSTPGVQLTATLLRIALTLWAMVLLVEGG